MQRLNTVHLPRIIQWLALLATLVSILVWARMLTGTAEPAPAVAPPMQAEVAMASPAGHWFDSVTPPLQVTVSGLMATAEGAVAILSINDAPARAYLAGESLGREARLLAIEPNAVVVEQGGESQRVAIAELPGALHMPSLLRH